MSVIVNIISFEMLMYITHAISLLEKKRERFCRIVLLPGSWITAQFWLELCSASQVVQKACHRIRQSNLLAKYWLSSFSVDFTIRTRFNTTIHVFNDT